MATINALHISATATAGPTKGRDTQSAVPTLVDLPTEIVLHVLSHLETRDVGACAMTARALAAACDDHALWTHLHERERAGEEVRWRAGARSIATAVGLCSTPSSHQAKYGPVSAEWVFNKIADAIGRVIHSPWHRSVDLVALLGHPRFACAARANVRVVIDSHFDTAPRTSVETAHPESYATVGTIIRCTGISCTNHAGVRVHRGFFDADGVLCGLGLADANASQSRLGLWTGCAGLWTKGRATMADADAYYGECGDRYRGGLLDGLCHGRGRVLDHQGTVVIAGEWDRGVVHGSCSWRSPIHKEALVGNAAFADGSTAGPVAYFARGRLVMRVPRLYTPYALGKFVDRFRPTIARESHHFAYTNRVYALYGPSGTTVVSLQFFVHVWPDGALVAGKRQGEHYCWARAKYEPLLFIDTRPLETAPGGGPLVIALGPDSTLERDPHTLAVRTRAGLSIGPAHRDLITRDSLVVEDAPPGLARDADPSGTPAADQQSGGTERDDDYALTQQDFARAIVSASRGRVGLDEADEAALTEGFSAASATSAALLALLDTCAAPLPTGWPHDVLSGGRVRGALFVADSESGKQTTGLDMARCAMRECVVINATFNDCDFRRARFDRCVFYGCRFDRCGFFGAVLVDTRFEGCLFPCAEEKAPSYTTPHVVRADAVEQILVGMGARVERAAPLCAEKESCNGNKRKRHSHS